MSSEIYHLRVIENGRANLPSPKLAVKAKRAAELARHSTSKRTRIAYWAEFATFERWCDEHEAPAMPTTPEVLATYLADQHERGRAASSLGLMRAAVQWVHREMGHDFNSRSEALRKVLSGAKRQRKCDPKRVRPFLVADFLELSSAMGQSFEEIRDRAMLALGLARALRGPSELITLDLDRLGSSDGRGFIEIGSAGIMIKLIWSKTSQETTREMFIERGLTTEAVEHWIRAARITSGTPLWRPVTHSVVRPGRLSARTWQVILKRRVAELYRLRGFTTQDAKREASKYATHSLRAGMITTLADAGATLSEIRDVSGHAEGSASIILGYMRRQGAGVKQIKKVGL